MATKKELSLERKLLLRLAGSRAKATKKRSPKFPAHVKPVRNGVYRRRIPGIGTYYSKWRNGLWYMYGTSISGAADSVYMSNYQDHDFTWWGLAEEPKPTQRARR